MSNTFIKTVTIFLSLVLIVCHFCAFGVFATEEAIPISSKAELNNIRNNLSGNYYLTCDIEFDESDFVSGGAYYNSGKCFVPIGNGKSPFTGTFDGRGYTVSGLKISVSGKVYSMSVTPVMTIASVLSDDGWTGDYIIDSNPNVSPAVGLFGANTGTIKNLTVTDSPYIAGSSNSATLYIGGIAGHNNGNIINCAVKNNLYGDTRSHIGGIVGYQSGGNVSNCFARGQIKSEGTFGGVIATVAGGSVSNCYSEVSFTEDTSSCFSVVSADVFQSISNCYYISNFNAEGYGERISASAAKDPKSFKGFEFKTHWYMSGILRRPAIKGVLLPEGEDITTGDLDGDKKVDLKDVAFLAKYIAQWDVVIYDEVANVNFDFNDNGDDIVNLKDVVDLARYAVGWEGAVLY